ncbi:unnamed protein product [Malus baccata var. baccata]
MRTFGIQGKISISQLVCIFRDLISISAETYTRVQVLGMEKAFLKKLKFHLNAPTPYVLMLRFLKAAQSETKQPYMSQGAPCRLLLLGPRCSANTLVMKYPKSETVQRWS